MLRVGGVPTWFIHVCSGSLIWNFHLNNLTTTSIESLGKVELIASPY
jgi:hypothetical protein